MDLLRRMFIAAVAAGVLSGLFSGIVHQFTTVPIIVAAEVFERAANEAPPASTHDEHEDGGWEPSEGMVRIAVTILADILAGIGFALLLVAGFAIVGTRMDWRRGFSWGVAAFITFMLAPGLGLPPEVPGTSAAPLMARQLWWASTVGLTGVALVLLHRKQTNPLWSVVAVAMIALPHAIGAPNRRFTAALRRESLAHWFVFASMVSGLLFWIVAGTLAGLFYKLLVQPLWPARLLWR